MTSVKKTTKGAGQKVARNITCNKLEQPCTKLPNHGLGTDKRNGYLMAAAARGYFQPIWNKKKILCLLNIWEQRHVYQASPYIVVRRKGEYKIVWEWFNIHQVSPCGGNETANKFQMEEVQLQRVPAQAGISNLIRFQSILIVGNRHSGVDQIQYQNCVLDI